MNDQNSCRRLSAVEWLISVLSGMLDIASICVARFVDVVVHPVQTTRAVYTVILRWHDWIFEDHDDPRRSKVIVWIFVAFVIATMVIVLRLARLNDQELIRRFG